MKIRIDIDVTPEELRQFFGLPDVEPLQQEMLDELKQRWREGVEGYDPATLLKPVLPAQMQMFEALQKSLWSAMQNVPGKPAKSDD
ncbi:MAG: DUF6489 family protein [Pseudomonadota bacterium]